MILFFKIPRVTPGTSITIEQKCSLFCNIKIILDQLIKHANIGWNQISRCNNCLKLNWHSWVDCDISACSSISSITATVPVAAHKYNCKRFRTIILVCTGAGTFFTVHFEKYQIVVFSKSKMTKTEIDILSLLIEFC